MKYLYNPATDEFESLAPTLKDRFDLKDQVADASDAVKGTEDAIGLSLDSFKAYQNAGGTMSYKDFIASGNEGVSRFFKDGGRVDFKYGGTFEEYVKREDKFEDLSFEEWLREDKKDGGRVGFKTGPNIIINAYNSVKAALGFNPSIEQVRTNLKTSGYSPALDYTKGILEGAELELDKPRESFKKEVIQIYDDLKKENKKILTRDIANKVTTSKAKGNS